MDRIEEIEQKINELFDELRELKKNREKRYSIGDKFKSKDGMCSYILTGFKYKGFDEKEYAMLVNREDGVRYRNPIEVHNFLSLTPLEAQAVGINKMYYIDE